MSWGIIIKNVEVLRVHKDEIDSKIQEIEFEIIESEKTILQIASMQPRDVLSEYDIKNEMSPVDVIKERIAAELDTLAMLYNELALLTQAAMDLNDVEDF